MQTHKGVSWSPSNFPIDFKTPIFMTKDLKHANLLPTLNDIQIAYGILT